METGAWKTVLSYILGVVVVGCLAAGIISKVQNEDLGLSINSWYLIAIAVFMGAAWLAIMRMRPTRKVRSISPESE